MTAPRPIFLHGVIAGPSSWGVVPERFDGGAVLGLPGHPAGTPVANAADLVEWTALAVGQLDGPRVLVGQGLGAQLALRIAQAHPELVDGVIGIGVASRLRVPDVPADHDAAITTVLSASMNDPDSDFGESLELAMQIIGPASLAADLVLARDIDLTPIAAAIGCPVLLVVGSGDRWAPPDAAAGLAASLPDGHMVLVDGVSHLVHADAPRTTELLVAAYLARLELTLDDR